MSQCLPQKERIQIKTSGFLMLRRGSDHNDIERKQINCVLERFPKQSNTYRAKEEFFDVYLDQTRKQAENRASQWSSTRPSEIAPVFEALLTAITNWLEEIFSYFDHRYTNALTESMNALIKAVNRAGSGYSLEILRGKMLYAPNALISRSTSIRTTQWRGSPKRYLGLVVGVRYRMSTSLAAGIRYYESSIIAFAEIFESEARQLASQSMIDLDSEREGIS